MEVIETGMGNASTLASERFVRDGRLLLYDCCKYSFIGESGGPGNGSFMGLKIDTRAALSFQKEGAPQRSDEHGATVKRSRDGYSFFPSGFKM